MSIHGILRNLINAGSVITEKHCSQLVGENNNLTGNERGKLSSPMEYYSSALSVVQGQLYTKWKFTLGP